MMHDALISVLVCAAAAGFEGMAAGRGVRERFAELRLPPFSPPLTLWIMIGLAYYAICFLLIWRLLGLGFAPAERAIGLAMIIAIMLANAGWGLLFFRLRNLRASYLAFFPYGILVLALGILLVRIDMVGAFILLPYFLYLAYAAWWGRALWRLNEAAGHRTIPPESSRAPE